MNTPSSKAQVSQLPLSVPVSSRCTEMAAIDETELFGWLRLATAQSQASVADGLSAGEDCGDTDGGAAEVPAGIAAIDPLCAGDAGAAEVPAGIPGAADGAGIGKKKKNNEASARYRKRIKEMACKYNWNLNRERV